MSFLKDLSDMKSSQILLFTFLVTSTLAPGILIVYFYKTELFINLSALKLILFSIAITSPIFILNSMLIGLTDILSGKHEVNLEVRVNMNLGTASLISTIVLWSALGISILFTLTEIIFLDCILIGELLFFIRLLIDAKQIKEK